MRRVVTLLILYICCLGVFNIGVTVLHWSALITGIAVLAVSAVGTFIVFRVIDE